MKLLSTIAILFQNTFVLQNQQLVLITCSSHPSCFRLSCLNVSHIIYNTVSKNGYLWKRQSSIVLATLIYSLLFNEVQLYSSPHLVYYKDTSDILVCSEWQIKIVLLLQVAQKPILHA